MLEYVRHLLRVTFKEPVRQYRGPEYDLYEVMRSLLPPGFVSGFMRDDAVKVSPKQGLYIQVARLDEPITVAYLMDEDPPTELRHITARLEMSSYRTAFGAHIHYVVDPVTHVMYYSDNHGGPDTQSYHLYSREARNHLRRVMRNCIKDY